jgi:hypothetical protein
VNNAIPSNETRLCRKCGRKIVVMVGHVGKCFCGAVLMPLPQADA